MPEWDIELTVPLVKDYTLGEFTDKLNNSKFSYDPLNDSLIIYKTSLRIDPFNVADKENMKFIARSIHKRILISEINLQPAQEFNYTYRLDQVFNGLAIGTNSSVPAITGIPKSDNTQLNNFQEFDLYSGKLIITFINQFPFNIRFESIRFSNNTIENQTEIGVINNKIIRNNSTETDSTITLSNKKISNIIKVEFTISTPGTNGNTVFLDPNNLLTIKTNLRDIKIKSAITSINSQTYIQYNSTSLDNTSSETKISQVILSEGKLNIKIDNYTKLGGKVEILFPEIMNGSNPFFINDINILPNQNLPIRSYNLNQLVINPVGNNELTAKTTIITNSTNNDVVHLYGSDSLVYDFSLEDLSIHSITGKAVSKIDKSISLPTEDINQYFDGNMIFSEANIKIQINNGTNLPYEIKNGIITGYNKATGKTEILSVDNSYITPRSSTTIFLNQERTTDFINKFTKYNSFPKTINFSGEAVLNTNNSSYTFTSQDTIGGYVDIQIPLKVSIQNYGYSDTLETSFSDSEKEQMDRFNKGKISIQTKSWIPATSGLKLNLLNKNYQTLISFPIQPYRSPEDSVYYINSAEVDINGVVKNPKESFFIVEITKEDILKIKDSKFCELKLYLNTPPNVLVSFKKDDIIKIKVLSEFGYRVK
jgi:hypothetical protein